MSVDIHAALVGGTIAGVVVFLGLLVEFKVSRNREERSRQKALLADILGDYLAAIAANTRAGATQDMETVWRSGSRILAGHGQLLVFGTPEMISALKAFDESGKNMGTPEGQRTLLELLRSIRGEVLPNADPFNEEVAQALMFESRT